MTTSTCWANARQRTAISIPTTRSTFPTQRWINLQIEHELYCHGHLIEAGVSHYQATGARTLLDIALKAADRIVTDFMRQRARHTPPATRRSRSPCCGYTKSPNSSAYLEMARQFLDQRGQTKGLCPRTLPARFLDVGKREKWVEEREEAVPAGAPAGRGRPRTAANAVKKPRGALLRWYLGALNGQYFQQHQPLAKQTIPVGHAVRFAYLQTAAAMLERITGDTAGCPPWRSPGSAWCSTACTSPAASAPCP